MKKPTSIKVAIIFLTISVILGLITIIDLTTYLGPLIWLMITLELIALTGLYLMKKWGAIVIIILGGASALMGLSSLIIGLAWPDAWITTVMIILTIFYAIQTIILLIPIKNHWNKFK